MKFETVVEKIIPLIEASDRVTARNATLPILNTILLIVANKVLKIRATNLSLGVEFELPIKTDTEGVVAVDGKTLYGFLSTLSKNAKINFELKETVLHINSNTNKTTIKTFPYEDFPTLPPVSGSTFKLPKKEFLRGVKSTAFAAATSDIKPEIASIYIVGDKQTITFAATDSFRLAEKKESVSKPVEFESILLPLKNSVEIVRILEDIDGDIETTMGENQVSFKSNSVYITSRIVHGSFPNYSEIIPKTFETEVVVLKQDLLTTLKGATIFSDKFNQVTLSVSPSSKKIECIAKNTDVGEFSGDIAGTINGEDVSVAINQKYLIDSLTVIPQDSVAIGLNGSNKALVVRAASDQSFTYLLMPMNR